MKPAQKKEKSIFGILGPYRTLVIVLAVLTIIANGIALWSPKIISHAIDAYVKRELVISDVGWELAWLGIAIFIATVLQTVVQTYASEMVARDLRSQLVAKLSTQTYSFVQDENPSTLLTNLTSDMDSVKLFVSMAVASIISSVVLIFGASILLLETDWKLALAVLTIVPVIFITFNLTLKRVRTLFIQSRAIIDRLNRVINESILGSALVRVLNSQTYESQKFSSANGDARDLSLKIVKIFAGLIPVITFVASLATFIILGLGGHFVVTGGMSLGDFTAFNTYAGILIFPIIMLGFMSNIIAQGQASYGRIVKVLDSEGSQEGGAYNEPLKGKLEAKDLKLSYGESQVLKNVSFTVTPGSRTAIIGPTAAGKTQLLYALTGLLQPQSGQILYDGHELKEYDPISLYSQVGLVFQDSIVFNMTLKENIAFSTTVTDESLDKAIRTAELFDLIEALPDGLDTIVSERGTSLSGGQKQRLMLARALSLDPTVLFLDDFTARVDAATEQKILKNLRENYPKLTLLSVTQKVASVELYDNIILLMEGEVLAEGTHTKLIKSSPEYVQIYESQQSTNSYEVHPQ